MHELRDPGTKGIEESAAEARLRTSRRKPTAHRFEWQLSCASPRHSRKTVLLARPRAPARPGPPPFHGLACPRPAPVWLRASLLGASGPRCRRRNTARRYRGPGDPAPLQWPLPRGRAVSAPFRPRAESSRPPSLHGTRPTPPCRRGGPSRPLPAPRAPRIVAEPRRPPPSRRKPAPSHRSRLRGITQPSPGAHTPPPGDTPEPPAASVLHPRGEQFCALSLARLGAVWSTWNTDGVLAESLL